jgi:hypothetical protein
MKMKSYYWLIIGAVVSIGVDFVLDVPHLFDKPFDYQTAHYGILAVAGALIFGGLVEWRLETLNKKVDRLLTTNRFFSTEKMTSAEDEVFRATFELAARQTASDRRGRPLTKEEEAFYDSFTEPALAVNKLVQQLLKKL